MNWIRQILARRKLYRELSEEIQQHLAEKADALAASGMSREDAVAAARREFGNVTSAAELGREVWQWPTLDSFAFDIRYALRQLRRQPSFTLIAVLILGLGIGANTAVFSVLDPLLFEPLPFRSPERLVWLANADGDTNTRLNRTITVVAYEALQAMQSFEEITTYEAFFARSSYKLTGDREPDRVAGVMVPANFFPFLGVAPLLGRSFSEEECKVNGPGAAILSYALWERRYSFDPEIIGRQIIINDRAATIVAVMPREFDFGGVFAPGIHIEIYVPAKMDELRDWGSTLGFLGRLKPGATREQAQAEANAIVEPMRRDPDFGWGRSYNAIFNPLGESITSGVRKPMFTVWAAVGLVLLIVCVNLSNLLLARASTRNKEMALRGAIGAGRGRLIRQLLTESFVLSLLGGALGIGLAYAAVAYVRRLESLSIPLLKNVEINTSALALTLGVTIVAAILFGLAPAMTVARADLMGALKEGGRGSSEGRDHRWIRSWLVVSEVALASLLLVGAGLLLRSFFNILDVNLGFQASRAYALRVDAGPNFDTAEKFYRYVRRLIAAVRDVPGIEAASITDAIPFDSNRAWGVRRKDQPETESKGALLKVTGPGLISTMRTPLIAGREFTENDDDTRPLVALVNETLAKRLWPDQDPLLQSMFVGNKERQVVGVVGDVRHLSVENATGTEVYLPLLQQPTMSPSLIVRTNRPIDDVAPALRGALTQVVSDMPTEGFRPLQQIVDRAVSSRRFFVNLLMAFAGAALALAAIGIYGVISYSVSRRTSEIGLRMALGASTGRIRSSVVRDTLRLAIVGVVIGLVGAVALSSLLASMLFGVSAEDPWTYLIAAAVLLFVALGAGFIPAFRASRISPMAALRAD